MLFSGIAFAQTFEEFEIVEQKLTALNEKCRTRFTNEECNDEREYLRGQLEDWSENPEIEIRKKIRLRHQAFDHARRYCEKEKVMELDQAMKFEISIHKPELEKARLLLDRKRFCYCRADRRLRAFGKEGAGSFYVLNDDLTVSSHLPPETISEIRNIEKQIFISCFEHPEIVPTGSSDNSFEEKFSKGNHDFLSAVRGKQTVFRFEMIKSVFVHGGELRLISFENAENIVTASFKDQEGKIYKAHTRSDGRGGTFYEGFPFKEKFAQVVRFVPGKAVTLRFSP